MTFKIGDKVKVKNDLIVGKAYGLHLIFVREMVEFMGKELEVVDIEVDEAEEPTYRVSGSPFWWNDKMVEPAIAKCCDTCANVSCSICLLDSVDMYTFYCSEYKLKENKTKKDYWVWAYVDDKGCWRQTSYFYDDDFNSNLGPAVCGILDAKRRKKLEYTKITI